MPQTLSCPPSIGRQCSFRAVRNLAATHQARPQSGAARPEQRAQPLRDRLVVIRRPSLRGTSVGSLSARRSHLLVVTSALVCAVGFGGGGGGAAVLTVWRRGRPRVCDRRGVPQPGTLLGHRAQRVRRRSCVPAERGGFRG